MEKVIEQKGAWFQKEEGLATTKHLFAFKRMTLVLFHLRNGFSHAHSSFAFSFYTFFSNHKVFSKKRASFELDSKRRRGHINTHTHTHTNREREL